MKKLFHSLTLAILLFAASSGSTAANGKPIKVFLNYLPEYSNYGPEEARGEALVSIGEAWIELTAIGLPRLTGERYEAWLVEAESGTMLSLGRFNADAEGKVVYHAQLEQIPYRDYRYLVVTVEPNPDPDPRADPRRSIAGVLPDPEIRIVSGTPVPTPAPGTTVTPAPPTSLPTTGAESTGLWAATASAVLAAFLALWVRKGGRAA